MAKSPNRLTSTNKKSSAATSISRFSASLPLPFHFVPRLGKNNRKRTGISTTTPRSYELLKKSAYEYHPWRRSTRKSRSRPLKGFPLLISRLCGVHRGVYVCVQSKSLFVMEKVVLLSAAQSTTKALQTLNLRLD